MEIEMWSIVLSSIRFILVTSFSCSWLCALDGCLVIGAGVLQRQWGLSVFEAAAYLGLGHAAGVTLGALLSASLGAVLLPLALLSSIFGFSVIIVQLSSTAMSARCEHSHESGEWIGNRRLLIVAILALSGDSFLFGEGVVGFAIGDGLSRALVLAVSVAIVSGLLVALFTGLVAVAGSWVTTKYSRQFAWLARPLLAFAGGILVISVITLVARLLEVTGLTEVAALLTNLLLALFVGLMLICADGRDEHPRTWTDRLELVAVLVGVQTLWLMVLWSTELRDVFSKVVSPTLPGLALALYFVLALGFGTPFFWKERALTQGVLECERHHH